MKKIIYIVLSLSCFNIVNGQTLLTLEEAVSNVLENNFSIKIAKNELKVDELNNSIGNAGMLPKIGASVTNNNTVQYAELAQSNGNQIEIEGARNMNSSYGVGLDWTVFDGFKMFAKSKQLKEFQNLGETELRLAVLSKVSEVYNLYYSLAIQQKHLTVMDSIISVSEYRLATAQNRFLIGKASKLEVLNAEVDRNSDLSNQVRIKEQRTLLRIYLNELMSLPAETEFVVQEEVLPDVTLKLTELLELSEEQNPELQMIHINKKIQEYELKQVRANRYPVLSLNTGYNLVHSQSPFGFVTETTGRNFTYGFTATMNIFDGFNQNRNEKTATLQLQNTELQIEQQKLAIQSRITSIYQTYLTHLHLVGLEEDNERIAAQNLDITLEKFKIGTVTPVDFRTAQVNYLNAVMRWQNALLDAKLSETALKELAGTLTF
ncbi:MAG: TolC family protein [Flavobacteriaceae bacterium]|jgi:outer membrane protein TolC|nr:TolC family protein [Flavobacteriaceae bacterium]